MRGLHELVQDLAAGERLGVGQVEGVAVDLVVGEVGDVVHRASDEVDRDEVDVVALRPDQREPLRQRVAQLLDQLEEVVGPVDLVHLAGLRVADDDAGPVDAQRRLQPVPDELLGLVLRAVVGMREVLALVEHRLEPGTAPLSGHGDGAGVVEAADVLGVRELHESRRVPRATGGSFRGVGALSRVVEFFADSRCAN